MNYAFFPGCKIPYYLQHYGASSRAVCKALGLELVEVEFNCCGYPVRNLNFESFILSAARNLALAGRMGLNILTPCKCCFGSLKHADHWLREKRTLRDRINRVLNEEGMQWDGGVEITHLLSVLAKDVGLEFLKTKVKHRFEGLRVAVHYGCHALRPGAIVQFDNPLAPTLFEGLVGITGAQCVEWSRRLDCCGYPLWEKNNELSLALMRMKLLDAKQAGALYLLTACTYCQIQFDTVQGAHLIKGDKDLRLPSILYPQLLGLSLGLPEGSLGLEHNKLDISGIKRYVPM